MTIMLLGHNHTEQILTICIINPIICILICDTLVGMRNIFSTVHLYAWHSDHCLDTKVWHMLVLLQLQPCTDLQMPLCTHTHTHTHTNKHTGRERHTCIHTHTHTNKHTGRERRMHTHTQSEIKTHRGREKDTHMHTDTHAHTHCGKVFAYSVSSGIPVNPR